MPQKDLFVECPQPAAAQVEVTCKHCHHFADVPYYSVDGKRTVCSHERIGRRPNEVPCPHFAVNMSIFKRLSPETSDLLTELLETLDLDFAPDKSKAQRGRDLASLTHLSLVLRAIHNARKAGFELGATYAIENSDVQGTLTSLGKAHATITAPSGISYTVEHRQIGRR